MKLQLTAIIALAISSTAIAGTIPVDRKNDINALPKRASKNDKETTKRFFIPHPLPSPLPNPDPNYIPRKYPCILNDHGVLRIISDTEDFYKYTKKVPRSPVVVSVNDPLFTNPDGIIFCVIPDNTTCLRPIVDAVPPFCKPRNLSPGVRQPSAYGIHKRAAHIGGPDVKSRTVIEDREAKKKKKFGGGGGGGGHSGDSEDKEKERKKEEEEKEEEERRRREHEFQKRLHKLRRCRHRD
ncbi:hypothetical protein HYALB_00002549 [Hymenoscyphus albidus]|uniref:Uncharacterized protein n=1 Tax=Hymenoscyphus albidus TaxID=595503 RepID=A0A9N9QAK1_9HELO|nr:hypothetical protein HYALB_00002549 [Hymenoscyphus albidus]